MGTSNSKKAPQATQPRHDDGLAPLTDATPLAEREARATMQLMAALHRDNAAKAAWFASSKLALYDDKDVPYCYKPLRLPLDDEGYVTTCAFDDPDAIREFYNTYGVVVVSGILSKDEAAASRTQLWDFMERQHPQLKRDDPRTWDDHWPRLKHLGILGNDVCLSPQFCENRQNERLHRAFSAVLGTKRLLVNVGRASAMRPTKSVAWGDAVVDKPEWKTLTGWVHWDMNPWTGETTAFSYESRDFRKNRGYTADKVQGVLTLVDCGPRDGGFHCVPGFHRHIRGWASHNRAHFNPHAHGTTIQVPEEDPMKADAQPVPARAGCIVIWSSALPHGTFPNDSDRGRMVQYIKMARCDDDSLGPVFVDEELLPPSFQLTPLGRQLYGFDEWPADPDERPWSTLPTAGSDGAGGGAGAGAGAGAGDHSGTSRPP